MTFSAGFIVSVLDEPDFYAIKRYIQSVPNVRLIYCTKNSKDHLFITTEEKLAEWGRDHDWVYRWQNKNGTRRTRNTTRRNTKPKIPKYSPTTTSSLDYEIQNLLSKDQKSETGSNLTEIKGIGPQRALELELAGVKTISDLAKRSPKHLAEKTGIPITQISKWIIEANKLKKWTNQLVTRTRDWSECAQK